MSLMKLRRRPPWKAVLWTIGILCFVLSVLAYILGAVEKIRSGHGAEQYVTARGIPTSYISGLITVIIGLILAIFVFARIWLTKGTSGARRKKRKRYR